MYETYIEKYNKNYKEGMEYMETNGLWNQMAFGDIRRPGDGKSYSYFCEDGKIDFRLECNPDLRGVVLVAPLNENLTDTDLRSNFYSFCSRNGKVPIIQEGPTFNPNEFKRNISVDNSFVLVLLTLPAFVNPNRKTKIRNYELIVETMKTLDLVKKIVLVHSEAHRSPAKDNETYRMDSGLNPNYNNQYLRRKSYKTTLPVFDSTLMDSATPTQSMIKSPNEFYFPERPPKLLGMFRCAPIETIYEFDYDKDTSLSTGYGICKNALQNMVLKTFEMETKMKHLIKAYKCNKLEFIVPKGMIRVNMVHPEYNRINRINIKSMFEELDLPKNISPFEVIIMSHEGIKTYMYKIEGVLENGQKSVSFDKTENNFEGVQDVFDTMNDPTNTKYRFIVVTEMGNQGVNIPSIYTYLAYRQPTGQYEGNPVIHNSHQSATRPSRKVYSIEEIQQHKHLTSDEVLYLWTEFNQTNLWVPRLSDTAKNPNFWRDVKKKLREDYYMSYEILRLFDKNDK